MSKGVIVQTMQRLLCLLCLVATSPLPAQESDPPRLADRAAIQEVMQQYVWSVDSLDADSYVAVFTTDAVIDSNGTLIRGHEAIRKVVTDMAARQGANKAEGRPAGALYHVISNERIEFTGPDQAIYRSYWQTMRKAQDNRYITGGFGRSEDLLIRRAGRWLIQHRKLTVFTD
jgi:ketosteroid isomerase-like protein